MKYYNIITGIFIFLFIIITILNSCFLFLDITTHQFKDDSKTIVTEIECETVSLFTNQQHNAYNTWNDFYVLAKSNDGTAYMFKVKDEIEWKLFHEGSTILIQQIQDYRKNGEPYTPYYICNNEKINKFEEIDNSRYEMLIKQKSENTE